MAGDALSSLVADTRPDDEPPSVTFDLDEAERAPVADDELDDLSAASAEERDDDVAPDEEAPPARHVVARDFGHHADDLLPAPEKKGRRGRR
jgi:hypothetical protein